VPDPNSPWAERHEFSINSDGTATHWRYSGDSCAGIVKEEPQNYTLTIPTVGQINFVDASGAGTFYDIYQISGSTLQFGHGFRVTYPAGMTFGLSEGQRFTSLNTFLAYKKQ
jgi:hypothetical protein